MFSLMSKDSIEGAGGKLYLVECKPDGALVKVLTHTSRKNILHAGGKTELLRKLTERFANAKGIVDEDPLSPEPPHLRKFEEKQELTQCDIRILYQRSGNNILIILCPKLEDWVLKAVHEANVNPKDYGLPDNPERLHEQINIKTDKFQELVESIQSKSERLKKLKQHLM